MRCLLLSLLLCGVALAQDTGPFKPVQLDTTITYDAVVVTATRTAKELVDVAVPTAVVTAEQIQAQGATRLGQVLETIPGLQLFDDHGSGLQVQGFSPDYTLILIDGEPIIGRTAGTLDLDRITVQGVERVEVVRGPSSSLYGSEALAGVVNIITRQANQGVRGSLGAQTGSFGRSDLTGEVEGATDRFGARLLLNRFGSNGYDLTPDVFGQTAPSFTDYTVDFRGTADLNDRVDFSLGIRGTREDQSNVFALTEAGALAQFDSDGKRLDWSVHPEMNVQLSNTYRLNTTLYAAGYETETRYRRQSDGSLYFSDDFDQRLLRAESQLNAVWSPKHFSIVGGGVTQERLLGDRYGTGADAPQASQFFAFAQHEWLASKYFEANVSARIDAHDDYDTRFSPKVALLVRPLDRLRLRASIGSGFKAPAFRQLYLAFTNAAAGYSVFGVTRIQEGIERLDRDGQINEVYLPLDLFGSIEAETSVAYNAGFTFEPFSWMSLRTDVFYNDVENLIETQPVAQKSNGSFVFGYFNIAELYTRGIETEVTATPMSGLTAAVGYQFLQARDRDIVRQLEDGLIFGRDLNGRDSQLSLSDYGGLFGRSPHSATMRLTYQPARQDLTISLRGRWRSRYGYRDLDGNAFANRDDEFVPAYALFDMTASKRFRLAGSTSLDVQAGVDNIFDITRPTLVPSMPGRRLFAGLRVSL
ncbi:MAG: TonB-dependent receptor [Bacteroidota bacterium]